jgi:hypothetical protein
MPELVHRHQIWSDDDSYMLTNVGAHEDRFGDDVGAQHFICRGARVCPPQHGERLPEAMREIPRPVPELCLCRPLLWLKQEIVEWATKRGSN